MSSQTSAPEIERPEVKDQGDAADNTAEQLRADIRQESSNNEREQEAERQARNETLEQNGGINFGDFPLTGIDKPIIAMQGAVGDRNSHRHHARTENGEVEQKPDGTVEVRDKNGCKACVRGGEKSEKTEITVGQRGDLKITRNNKTGETTFENTETGVKTTINGNDVKITDKDGNVIFQGTREQLRERLAAQQDNPNNPNSPDSPGNPSDTPPAPLPKDIEVKDGKVIIKGKDGEKAEIGEDNKLAVKDKDGKDLIGLSGEGALSFLGGLSQAADGSFASSNSYEYEQAADTAMAAVTEAVANVNAATAKLNGNGDAKSLLNEVGRLIGDYTQLVNLKTQFPELGAVLSQGIGMVSNTIDTIKHNASVQQTLAENGINDPSKVLAAIASRYDPQTAAKLFKLQSGGNESNRVA
jgi:hypothetical protein